MNKFFAGLAAAAGLLSALPAWAAPISASVASGTAINYDQSGGSFGVLTNNVLGTNNWTDAPGNYLGWTDSGYVPVDGGTDTGAVQPRLTFDLGGSYFVDSVTLHYIVGYPNNTLRANVHAPDSMTATFSTAGVGGPFAAPIVESALWNDAPAPVPNVGGAGEARSLTVPFAGTLANAVRLDFLSDAEWMLLSEVDFEGRVVPEPASCALLLLGACATLGGMRCRRTRFSKKHV
jgi:hypothetical protein